MKHSLKIFFAVLLSLSNACSLTDLEANLDNPNEVGVENLDVNLLMNKIMLEFGDFVAEANTPSMELSRMAAMTGGNAYNRAYQAQDHDDMWERAYQDVLIQIETLLGKTDGTAFTEHSGAARVLKAYVLLTLVDLYGDVPYSQALKGSEGAASFNPGTDGGASVYAAALALLEEAASLLATPPAVASQGLGRDIYYGGDNAKWGALANTLQLKAYLNLRLTSDVSGKITELLGKNLIDTDAEEFTYKYGTADIPPRSRHPLYRQMYQIPEGSASGYIGNYYMFMAYKAKGVEDPRWRYYFYRQVGSIAAALADEPESISCLISPFPANYDPAIHPFCAFDPGFFGREHGNADGIPPDGSALTAYGVYPAGGLSDKNAGVEAFQDKIITGDGANGAGIEPIWMASFTEFVKAEAALMIAGVAGDPAALLTSGVTKSITRVRAFAAAKGQALPAGLEPSEADYLAAVDAKYAAAATTDAKLDVLMTEYYLALWGNGIEAYNMYRRTGKPDSMQPMRDNNPGVFLRSLLYPANFVNLNSSTAQKDVNKVNKVFWDNNPDDFVY